MDFLCFPLQNSNNVNLTTEIGAKYLEFGTLLLEDQTGARISAFEVELCRNAQSMCFESGYMGRESKGDSDFCAGRY